MASARPKDLQVKYDVEADILNCSFGKPEEAVSIEIEDGVLLRVDPNDERRVVGFTILDFGSRSKKSERFILPLRGAKFNHLGS